LEQVISATVEVPPDDIETVRAVMRELIESGRSDEALDAAVALLSQLRDQNSELMLRLAALHRRQHRSEKIDPKQLALLLSDIELDVSAHADEPVDDGDDLEAELEAARDENARQQPKRKPRRTKLTDKIEQEDVRHDLADADKVCAGCGKSLRHLGDDTGQLLKLIPAHFVLEVHHQAKYACGRCKDGVKTAPGPARLVSGCMLDVSVLADIAHRKYVLHQPLTRIHNDYTNAGVSIPVSTLCDNVGYVADALEPLVQLILERARAAHVLQTDGSGIKVLDRDHPAGVRLGTMWCHVGDRRWVSFNYAPNASGEAGPWSLLAGREGFLQADAAATFDRLFNGQVASAIEVGCWSHARRKFVDLLDTDMRVARGLQLIQKLYRVEHLADERKCDEAGRLRMRQQRSTKYLERLKRWLRASAKNEPPKSAFAQACGYALRHWEALTRFTTDGALALDNNLCESQIRSLALGRKNYLFAGSDVGAQRAAVLYSITRTCALHGIAPLPYLASVLRRIATGHPGADYAQLLPDAWTADDG
jgi:transposase